MRLYEKLRKPIPATLLVLGFVILNPLHIPPDEPAQAEEIQVNEEVREPIVITIPRTPEDAKKYAKKQLADWGWDTPTQWQCLLDLWTKESNWRPDAYNKTPVYQNGEKLHAGGIPQILGLDPKITVEQQIERGFIYIESRYSDPCTAWRFWTRNNWY